MVYRNRPTGLRLSLPRMNPGGLPRRPAHVSLLHSPHFRVASAQRANRMFSLGSRQQILNYACYALRLLLSNQTGKTPPELEHNPADRPPALV